MDTTYHRSRLRPVAGMVLAALLLAWLPSSAAALPPLVAAAAGARPGALAGGPTTPMWSWPLAAMPRVVRPFDKPPGPYAAGHRGVDLAGVVGQQVLAVDDGVVHHVGSVAGRGTITIEHEGGLRSTYEPVTPKPGLLTGGRVRSGQSIASLAAGSSHCLPQTCLHLGALRRGSAGTWDYVQPLFYLYVVEVVLLPSG